MKNEIMLIKPKAFSYNIKSALRLSTIKHAHYKFLGDLAMQKGRPIKGHTTYWNLYMDDIGQHGGTVCVPVIVFGDNRRLAMGTVIQFDGIFGLTFENGHGYSGNTANEWIWLDILKYTAEKAVHNGKSVMIIDNPNLAIYSNNKKGAIK